MSDIKNLPHSIHEHLKHQAMQSGRPFEWQLRLYGMERFLYRLSRSKHRNKFVLKGGLIFVGWNIPLRRFTRDIDFRIFTGNDENNIRQIIEELCLQKVEPDGILFDTSSISIDAITENAKYPGIRVTFTGRLGEKTIIPMQIDLGFSDEITPNPLQIIYPAILKMPAPNLIGYPKETVVAEKLHCVVYRGKINSRFKDFYDLWFISTQFEFEGGQLSEAIRVTFRNRETEIVKITPSGLTNEFAEEKQMGWERFLAEFSPNFPEIMNFLYVIEKLRTFLLPVFWAAKQNESFDYCWDSEEGVWKPMNQ